MDFEVSENVFRLVVVVAEDVNWGTAIQSVPEFAALHVADAHVGVFVEIDGQGHVDLEAEVVLHSPEGQRQVS